MKKSIVILSLLAAAAFGQTVVTQSGSTTPVSKAVTWGGSADSTSTILLVGGVLKRDSSGTYVTSDSCSKWIPVEKGGTRPNTWYNLSFQARGVSSPPNTIVRVDTRYCLDPVASLTCGFTVPSGQHFIYGSTQEIDTMLVTSPTSLTGMAYSFYVTHGNQHRYCLDENVSSAGDSLYFNTIVNRGM